MLWIWKFLGSKAYAKIKWSSKRYNIGVFKTSYESYFFIHHKFSQDQFYLKNSFVKLLEFGLYLRNGYTSYNPVWNFSVSYNGWIVCKAIKKSFLKVSTRRFDWSWFLDFDFTLFKHNDLYHTFFSFLSRSYLLHYLMQFGHTRHNYNTSYFEYLLMVYNERFITNLLHAQISLKKNLRVLFKMFFLGGFVCLISTFNIITEGLVQLYSSFTKQPTTRYIWVNGLYSNFDKIFWSIQVKISNAYAARIFFSKKSIRRLIRLWFSMKGLFLNLGVDISFFPSMLKSSWVFLESCARFYPTMSVASTANFLPTAFLDYYCVSNDYSLLSLSFYINLLLISFRWTYNIWQMEFSVYPQWLLAELQKFQILPIQNYVRLRILFRRFKALKGVLKNFKTFFFDLNSFEWAFLLRFPFQYWNIFVEEKKKHTLWRYLYFFKEHKHIIL